MAQAAAPEATGFADALGTIPGLIVKANEPLARYTTFRIGGPAEWLVEVPTQAALVALLRLLRRADVPFHLLGLGSNVLIPDAGLPGVTAKLGGELRRARVRGTLVSAGGALALP